MSIIGTEVTSGHMTDDEVRRICGDALDSLALDGKRVLVIIPDHTRHAPLPLFFRAIADRLLPHVRTLDCLVATGTHAPEPTDRILELVGITPHEAATTYSRVSFFNHEHDNADALCTIGIVPAEEMHRLSDGLFSESLRVTINKRILDYDHLLLVSPVVPHEAAGFSGGNKYFFPGIGGVDIIQTFHWIAALITNPVINGMMETPVRRIIDRGASHVPVPSLAFCFVVGEEGIVGLYAGPPGEAWRPAARCSSHWHIRHTDRAFRRVIGVTPSIYEELWVGGKAMYKLEPVVEDGGELIIYGPQIREISFVHGKRILSVGYHVRDYFTAQWDRFSAVPKLILAHSTNVRGIGAFRAGREEPRITVTLATGIPEEVCRRVNLGYRDPRSLDPAAEARNPDTLVVPNAGQELYRLRHSTSITS